MPVLDVRYSLYQNNTRCEGWYNLCAVLRIFEILQVEEIAYRHAFINKEQLESLVRPLAKSGYGKCLLALLDEEASL